MRHSAVAKATVTRTAPPDLRRRRLKRAPRRLAQRFPNRWIYLYGFAKNERANIDKEELKALQEVAKELLEFDDRQLATALSKGELMEVCDGNENT